MTYDDLVDQMVGVTGIARKTIRDVLIAFPAILITLDNEEQVRTPLGVFRMMKRAPRSVLPPKATLGVRAVMVPAEMVVKLRAGNRLRKVPKKS